jgi:hypothetical protein
MLPVSGGIHEKTHPVGWAQCTGGMHVGHRRKFDPGWAPDGDEPRTVGHRFVESRPQRRPQGGAGLLPQTPQGTAHRRDTQRRAARRDTAESRGCIRLYLRRIRKKPAGCGTTALSPLSRNSLLSFSPVSISHDRTKLTIHFVTSLPRTDHVDRILHCVPIRYRGPLWLRETDQSAHRTDHQPLMG